MADYIPTNPAEFADWFTNLMDTVGDAPTTWCLTSGQVTALNSALSYATTAINAVPDLFDAYHAGVAAQNAAIAAALPLIRPAVLQIQACPSVTDAMRVTARLPVHSDTRTPAPIATTGPMVISAAAMTALHAVVEFRDQSTPDSKKKPPGQHTAEIRSQVAGTMPMNGDSMEYMGTDGKTPYMAVFNAGDEGKVAYYCLRWINTRGEPGPWGPVFVGTVPGAGGS